MDLDPNTAFALQELVVQAVRPSSRISLAEVVLSADRTEPRRSESRVRIQDRLQLRTGWSGRNRPRRSRGLGLGHFMFRHENHVAGGVDILCDRGKRYE